MKIDRRGFLKFLGIGAAVPAVASLAPANVEADPSLDYAPAGFSEATPVAKDVPSTPNTWNVITGNQYTPHSTDLMVDKSEGEERIPFYDHESIHDVRYTAEVSPVQFFQIHRCNDAPGGFEISTQYELPVGYWDDGTTQLGGKLRSAKVNEWVIYWAGYQNKISTITIGQAAYESLWAAESALYTEKPVLCPAIEAAPFWKRTAIIVKSNAVDLYDAQFIELPEDING